MFVILGKLLKKITTILVLVYVGFGLLLFFAQAKFIYFPSDQDFDACPYFSDSKKKNINGTRFYYKNNSEKLIVFYHGNAGSACDRAFLKDTFSNSGYSYIFVEYAGYSNDLQKPSQERIMRDVENINTFLKSSGHKEVVLAGESLGASLAVYHSSISNENKLLLISPFFSFEDAIRSHYPVYPVSWMLRDKYESNLWLNDIRKVQIIHGSVDTILPISGSKKLFGEMPVLEKKFVEVSGANHNDIYNFPETFSAIIDFLSPPK